MHAFHGEPMPASDGDTRFLRQDAIVESTTGTVPPCFLAQFPFAEQLSKWANLPDSPGTANRLQALWTAIDENCEMFNPGFVSLTSSDYSAAEPWERYMVTFTAGVAYVLRTFSVWHTRASFNQDWERLVELVNDEWDNPLAYDEVHNFTYVWTYDNEGGLHAFSSVASDPGDCDCAPDELTLTSNVVRTSGSITAYTVAKAQLVPLKRARRRWWRGAVNSGTLIECKSLTNLPLIRTQFDSPALNELIAARSPQDSFVYTWGAQCP